MARADGSFRRFKSYARPSAEPARLRRTLDAVRARGNALNDPEAAKIAQRQGLTPAPSSPQELTARIRADYAKWKRVLEGG